MAVYAPGEQIFLYGGYSKVSLVLSSDVLYRFDGHHLLSWPVWSHAPPPLRAHSSMLVSHSVTPET